LHAGFPAELILSKVAGARSTSVALMNVQLTASYDQRLPRYTSYPSAAHFTPAVNDRTYAEWLGAIPADDALSLYLHVPFCAELCLYCGCHTTAVRRYAPVADYVGLMLREIDLVAERIGGPRKVSHIHWGGGTPTILSSEHLLAVAESLRGRFGISPDGEIAIEIDPRTLTFEQVGALAAMGVNRASLGVQDFDETVQRTINRIQSYDETAQVAGWLRDAGIAGLNLDLMYGLPHQTVESVAKSVGQALTLAPDRIALFGYAHVPWMKRHQALLPEEHMPDAAGRLCQAQAASELVGGAGYVAIGLDHFARPDDPLTQAQRNGRLRRNFQGYTTDRAATLIGFGTSSIGRLPGGYVQNASRTVAYRSAIASGRLATVRGIVLSDEDRLRAAVIERLMCDLAADVGRIAAESGRDPEDFGREFSTLDRMAEDGIVSRDGYRVSVPEEARPYLRHVCAVFDRHLSAGETRYSRAL
jgi:oxygen-independent coproporphyrinogen-3 oxidase